MGKEFIPFSLSNQLLFASPNALMKEVREGVQELLLVELSRLALVKDTRRQPEAAQSMARAGSTRRKEKSDGPKRASTDPGDSFESVTSLRRNPKVSF